MYIATNDHYTYNRYCFENQDFVVLVAAGNSGNRGNSVGSVGSPATSKACISVGASVNEKSAFNGNCPETETEEAMCYDNLANFSSVGPTRLESYGALPHPIPILVHYPIPILVHCSALTNTTPFHPYPVHCSALTNTTPSHPPQYTVVHGPILPHPIPTQYIVVH